MAVVITVLFGLACIYMGFVKNAVMLGLGPGPHVGAGRPGPGQQDRDKPMVGARRGMVVGISGLLLALLGIGAFPNLVYTLITAFERRTAYSILGLGLLLIMAPLGCLFFRNRPEDFQLNPDGAKTLPAEDKDQPPLTGALLEENWTLKEAMHTRAFWTLVAGMVAFGMLSTGLFFHMVSIFQDRGLDPAVAASVFVPILLAAALTNLTGGMLANRIPVRFLMVVGLLFLTASLLMAQYLQGTGTAFLFGIILGATNSITMTAGSVTWPSFFGRANLGSIYGFTLTMVVVGASLGP